MSQLQRELAALQNEHPFVSIGCSATSAKQFVPRIISEVGRIAPEVHVRVITLPPDEAAAKVLRGELDFILTTEGFVSGRVEAEQILTARLFVVGQPTNPLARRRRVRPEEIARYPFALLPAPWSAQARFREWAANQGVEIRVAMELSSYDGLKEAARNGLALAVVAEPATHRRCSARRPRGHSHRRAADRIPDLPCASRGSADGARRDREGGSDADARRAPGDAPVGG